MILFEPDFMPVQLRQYATLLYEQGRGNVVCVCSGAEGNYQFALGSSAYDMRKASKWMNTKLNGRGGGSSLMVQGTWMASEAEIRNAFEKLMSGECEWN